MRMSVNKTVTSVAMAISLFGLGVGLSAFQMSHEMGMQYDVNTETTLTGTVESVMDVPGTGGMSGTHLELKTKTETIHVHLGPTAFVAKQGVAFAEHDQVSVTGSRIKGEGFEAILARSVKKGDKTITLRDEKGSPRWSMGG